VINQEKSELEPKQLFRHFGWEWDSHTPSICPPQYRVKSLLHELRAMRKAIEQQKTTTARRLAKLIGALSATRLQHRQAFIHLRTLDSFKNTARAVKGWDGETVSVIRNLLQDIEWWEQMIKTSQPRLLRFEPPQVSLYTDASPIGWGAHVHLMNVNEDIFMHGRWKKKGTSNALECKTVEQAIRRLRRWPEAESITSVVIRSDNTATCYNINRQAACDTLVPSLSSLLRFADRIGLQLTA
jgi:hypothetical protein